MVLYLMSAHVPLSVLSPKLYFLEIGPINQTLWSFKCAMLKTSNSKGMLHQGLKVKKLNNFLNFKSVVSELVESVITM